MNKSALFITIVACVTVVGYLLFDKYFKTEQGNIWDSVSDNAALVIEVSNSDELSYDELFLDGTGIIYPLVTPVVDSLLFSDFFSKSFSKLLISFHQVSNSSFGLTFFIELSKGSKSSFLWRLINKEADVGSRKYLEKDIYELSLQGISISFFIEDNQVFFSEQAFLIEDIIRLRDNASLAKFKDSNAEIMSLPSLVNDLGNVYINAKRFSSLLSSFLEGKASKIQKLAKAAFFDVSITDDQYVFNGFTRYRSVDFLNTFKNQTPVRDRFNYIIPTNAAAVTKCLTSNAANWENNLIDYWTKQEPQFLLNRNDFIKKYRFNSSQLFREIKDGLCHISINDKPTEEKLLFISLKDKNEVLNQINSLARSIAQLQNDSIYFENYDEYTIQELKINNFPMFLFGPEYTGFNSTYYVVYNDLLILSNGISVIKDLFDRIEREETWGRELAYNNFFDVGLEEINFSYSFNIQRLWPKLLGMLNPEWREYAMNHSIDLKRLKLWTLQFSKIDDSFYTNLAVSKQKVSEPLSLKKIKTDQALVFNNPLITKPFVVKNHNTNLLETIVQDSSFHLHLISNDGKHLWSVSLDGKMVGELKQIDYYKNGKLQYFVSTDKSIYVIDRLGNFIEGFPELLSHGVTASKVIDYDKSKNYRFLTVDKLGNLYLYNKDIISLEGWSPLAVNGIHSFTPFHQRIRGKDSFIYLLQSGRLNVLNRRGKSIKGFPLDLEGTFSSNSFVTVGTDFNGSHVSLVSDEGKLIQVNLAGELILEFQLFKQGKETSFELIPDALGKTFIIVRREENRLVVLDENGSEKFAKDYLGLGDMKLQYYYFSPENQVCVATDVLQGLTYLYNIDGRLINSQPIDSNNEVGIVYSESKNEYTFYAVSNNTFKKLKF